MTTFLPGDRKGSAPGLFCTTALILSDLSESPNVSRSSIASLPLIAASKSFRSTILNVLPSSMETSTLSAPAASPLALVKIYGDASRTTTTPGLPAAAGVKAPAEYLTLSVETNDFKNASFEKSGANVSTPLA